MFFFYSFRNTVAPPGKNPSDTHVQHKSYSLSFWPTSQCVRRSLRNNWPRQSVQLRSSPDDSNRRAVRRGSRRTPAEVDEREVESAGAANHKRRLATMRELYIDESLWRNSERDSEKSISGVRRWSDALGATQKFYLFSKSLSFSSRGPNRMHTWSEGRYGWAETIHRLVAVEIIHALKAFVLNQ